MTFANEYKADAIKEPDFDADFSNVRPDLSILNQSLQLSPLSKSHIKHSGYSGKKSAAKAGDTLESYFPARSPERCRLVLGREDEERKQQQTIDMINDLNYNVLEQRDLLPDYLDEDGIVEQEEQQEEPEETDEIKSISNIDPDDDVFISDAGEDQASRGQYSQVNMTEAVSLAPIAEVVEDQFATVSHQSRGTLFRQPLSYKKYLQIIEKIEVLETDPKYDGKSDQSFNKEVKIKTSETSSDSRKMSTTQMLQMHKQLEKRKIAERNDKMIVFIRYFDIDILYHKNDDGVLSWSKFCTIVSA